MSRSLLAVALGITVSCFPLTAYSFGAKTLPVNFHEYNAQTFALAKSGGKPVFMLFSAQWCHWCETFEEKSLKEQKVYQYLNGNFINIFIDADMRSDLVAEFDITYLPYVVFLKPDGTIHYKYGGTLYPEDFYGLIKKMAGDIMAKSGKRVEKQPDFTYKAPGSLDVEMLKRLEKTFVKTALDNFDHENFGLGDRIKTILPETFIYLLEHTRGIDKKEAQRYLSGTMKKAAKNMFDHLEGGFFRYTETAEWEIPHFEKMLDTNAGAALILSLLGNRENALLLSNALGKTYRFLGEKLFISETGAFSSFQVADDTYYLLDETGRSNRKSPDVIRKIHTDRLAKSLTFLVEIKPPPRADGLDGKIRGSLAFLQKMVEEKEGVLHYYSTDQKKWSYTGMLSDHAALALLFAKAHKNYGDDDYRSVAEKVIDAALLKFYDRKKRIFADKQAKNRGDFEYQMAQNAKLALAILLLDPKTHNGKWNGALEGVITYFSAVGTIIEERAWDSASFMFLENYAPYINVVNAYIKRLSKWRKSGARTID